MAEKASEAAVTKEDDEIELIDYINVLCKRKKLIIFGTLSSMLIAGVVCFLLRPVYRVNTIIEIGTIEKDEMGTVEKDGGKTTLIESPTSLVEKIRGRIYEERVREELNIRRGNFPEVRVKNPRNTALIELSIESSERDRDLEILKTMDRLILKDHSDLIHIEKYDLTTKIKETENNIILIKQEEEGFKHQLQLNKKNKEQIKKQIEGVSSRISELEREKAKVDRKANPDNTLTLWLFSNDIQENRRYLNQLQDRLNIDLEKEEEDLKNQMNVKENSSKSLMLQKDRLDARLAIFRNTRIVKKASYSKKPVRPKKLLNVTLAGAAGLFFFTFFAFFLEYLRGAKEKKGRLQA